MLPPTAHARFGLHQQEQALLEEGGDEKTRLAGVGCAYAAELEDIRADQPRRLALYSE